MWEEVRPSRASQPDVIQTPRNLRCVALAYLSTVAVQDWVGSRPCAGSISVNKGTLDALLKHLGEKMLNSPATAACVGEEELLESGLQRKGC